jgi:hypothetical protein
MNKILSRFFGLACAISLAACGQDAVTTGVTTDSEADSGASDVSGGTDAAIDVQDVGSDAITDQIDIQEPDVEEVDSGASDIESIDIGPGKCSAAQIKACDDGLACTTDKCTMPGGVCVWTMSDNFCFINGACVGMGETKPGAPCFVCDPKTSTKAWTALANGKPCDDGDLCTYDGACQEQKCVSKVTDCDDKNGCTTDSCDKLSGCDHQNLQGKACDDGNACTLADACTDGTCAGKASNCDDKNACTQDSCDMASGCTYTNLDGACSDGDGCTAGDTCAGGTCQKGTPKNCDDGNTCTIDQCYPNTVDGCYHLAKQSACCTGVTSICDDGNPCTNDDCDPATSDCNYSFNNAVCPDKDNCIQGSTCSSGTCSGNSITCNDANPCTNDSCDGAKGCVFAPISVTACDDNNACSDDACDPANGGCAHSNNVNACEDGDNCTVADACKDGTCASGTARNCDDGNVCTYDSCVPSLSGGCYHLATKSPCCTGSTSICDDGNPCTNDDCDPANPGTSGCKHTPNSAPCDDLSACTLADACTQANCAGTTVNCDDGNPCTADSCNPKAGCAHGNVDGGACDDGSPCTKADICTAGKCVGNGQCTCTMTFSLQASKFTTIAIGDGGFTGEGLDVDANPATCAPTGNCAAGINNSLGALAALANKPLGDGVTKGSIDFVLEYRDLKQGAITLGLYTAKLADSNATCDFQTATCDYNVSSSLVDYDKCMPIVDLPGKLAGNVIIAGGKGTNFPFSLPISGGAVLSIVIYGAQLNGTVTMDAGGNITAFDGILAGAVPKTTLAAAIDALPNDGSLPIPKDSLKAILDSTVEADIDSNGDGTLDAASIGLKLHGIAGKIVGTY